MMGKSNKKPNHWKGFIIGSIGSVTGILAMQYYWQAVKSITGKDPRSEKNTSTMHALDDVSLVGEHHEEGESSTMAVGRILDKTLTGKEPQSKETKTALSYQVHWAYGMTVGGIYGALRGGAAGIPDIPGGLAYGTGLWLFGSEVSLPLLGLSSGPTASSPASHAYGLGAHFAYGLATAATTQVLYRLL